MQDIERLRDSSKAKEQRMEGGAPLSPQFSSGSGNSQFRLHRGVLSIRGTRDDDLMRVFNVGDDLLRGQVVTNGVTNEKTYNKRDVKYVIMNGYSGDDEIRNETELRSSLLGAFGNDIISGGSSTDKIFGSFGNDDLNGNDGNDIINGGHQDDEIRGGSGFDRIAGSYGNDTIYGGDHRDIIAGQHGRDLIRGGSGNDYINGGKHDDVIYGGDDHDKIIGSFGNDKLVGEDGNDRLIGGYDNDRLYGGRGLDSLFGGRGVDEMKGNGAADRFLLTDSDTAADLESKDVEIRFNNTGTTRVNLNGRDYIYRAAGFFESEIIKIDYVLGSLVRRTGDNVLLKQSDGEPISFYRHGRLLNRRHGYSSWNAGNGEIHLASAAFSSYSWLSQNVLHQVGGNYDDASKNDEFDSFLALSNWQNDGSGWTYDPSARFVRRYGKTAPDEDFATSFAAYFMSLSNLRYRGAPAGDYGIGAQAAPTKMSWMSDWIDDLS